MKYCSERGLWGRKRCLSNSWAFLHLPTDASQELRRQEGNKLCLKWSQSPFPAVVAAGVSSPALGFFLFKWMLRGAWHPWLSHKIHILPEMVKKTPSTTSTFSLYSSLVSYTKCVYFLTLPQLPLSSTDGGLSPRALSEPHLQTSYGISQISIPPQIKKSDLSCLPERSVALTVTRTGLRN